MEGGRGLKALRAIETGLVALPKRRVLRKLELVDLYHSLVVDPWRLRECQNLSSLLMHHGMTSHPEHQLREVPHLGVSKVRRVVLDGCRELADASELGSWTELRNLYLKDCPKLPTLGFALARLTKLETLHLDNIHVLTDEDLLALRHMPALKKAYYMDYGMVDIDVDMLACSPPVRLADCAAFRARVRYGSDGLDAVPLLHVADAGTLASTLASTLGFFLMWSGRGSRGRGSAGHVGLLEREQTTRGWLAHRPHRCGWGRATRIDRHVVVRPR
jgi:hypothetical protein